MPVQEQTVQSFQGYSIIRIQELDDQGQVTLETFSLSHPSCPSFAEFSDLEDAIRELNRMLFPLPGLPLQDHRQAG